MCQPKSVVRRPQSRLLGSLVTRHERRRGCLTHAGRVKSNLLQWESYAMPRGVGLEFGAIPVFRLHYQ